MGEQVKALPEVWICRHCGLRVAIDVKQCPNCTWRCQWRRP